MLNIQFHNQTGENVQEYESLIKDILSEAVKQEGMTDVFSECNYIFIDNQVIKEMNSQFRGRDYATDVLTFPHDSPKLGALSKKVLGDVFISLEKTREQAEEYGHSLARELCFLAVHGFLHLLGYDHLDAESERVMFARQEAILDAKGIRR